MTIKEIENLSGIPRANIRYYEQEGLIDPKRLPNGYRAYSEEELAVLEKIKLLRGVGVSLEDIRALQKGDDELSAVMARRLRELEGEAKAIEEAKQLCKAIKNAGESYDTLNASKYMDALPDEEPPVVVIGPGVRHYPPCPWRRYFARTVDLLIYRTIWIVFFSFTFFGAINSQLLLWALTFVLMFILEPLQLCLFRTTIGKLLFGLQVTNNDAGRLTYGEALQRTWYVFVYGMGLGLPIVEIVTYWKGYKRCKDNSILHWEDYSNTIPRNMTWKHAVGISSVVIIWIVTIILTISLSQLPPNRGDLTVSEFAENYNFFVERYDLNMRHLTEEGQLYSSELDGTDGSIGQIGEQGNVVISIDKKPRLEFEYTLENGVITAVTARGELRDADVVGSCVNEQFLMVMALGGARREKGNINNHKAFVEEKLRNSPYKDCSFKIGGISIERTVDTGRYIVAGDMLFAENDIESKCIYREETTVRIVD